MFKVIVLVDLRLFIIDNFSFYSRFARSLPRLIFSRSSRIWTLGWSPSFLCRTVSRSPFRSLRLVGAYIRVDCFFVTLRFRFLSALHTCIQQKAEVFFRKRLILTLLLYPRCIGCILSCNNSCQPVRPSRRRIFLS